MLVSESMAKARSCLAVLLKFLAGADSFYFTINGATNTDFSLCRRLGFTSEDDYYAFLIAAGLASYIKEKGTNNRTLQVSSAGWRAFLQDSKYNLTSDIVEYDPIRTDLLAFIRGQRRVRRDQYHVLRIGQLTENSPRKFFDQKHDDTKT